MTGFQDFRQKYNSFDWEYYGSNYFDDEMKSLKLTKDDCWWHFLTIGQEKQYLFFDVKDKEERNKKNEDFDWEEYQLNYDLSKETYPTRFHLWWHYVNVGQPQGYLYFSKTDNYEGKKKKFNFDWEFYIKKYPYLFDREQVNEHKVWWHFLNKGKSHGYLYFSKLDSNKNTLKINNSLHTRTEFFKHNNHNIFIYIGNSLLNLNHPFNRSMVSAVSNILTQQFHQFNIYFVKYDFIIKQLIHLDMNEYMMLEKNGYITSTYSKHFSYSKHNSFFESIKDKKSNLLLFMEDISAFDLNKFEMMSSLFTKIHTCGLYSGNLLLDSIQNDELNSSLLSKYYKFLSKFDLLFTSSQHLKIELLNNFKQHKLASPNIIIPYSLPIEQYGLEVNSGYSVPTKNYILVVVSMNSNNHVIELIQAFSIYLEKNPSHQLYIYDNEFHTEIIYWRKVELLLNKNITLIKNKSKKDLNDLFRNSLFTISCVKNNPGCTDIKQSLFNKKLCISHNSGDAQELQEDFPLFIRLTDCSSPESLAEKMELCNDVELLQSLSILELPITKWSDYCSRFISDLQLKSVMKEEHLSKSDKYQILVYVEKVLTNHRSGIENYSVQIIRHLFKLTKNNSNFTIILVKWENDNKKLISCTKDELHHIVNYGEDNLFEDFVVHSDNIDFHKNILFLCPEIPDFKFNIYLSNFLINNNVKSVFILHDLLPLQFNFKEYEYLKEEFKNYLYNNICTAYKIISVSNFTQHNFIEYIQKYPYEFGCPYVVTIPMSYQFKDEKKYIFDEKEDDVSRDDNDTYHDKSFKILLPGTIESRKQQIMFMKIFNNFIKKNPELNVELIVFGKVVETLKNDFEKELLRSNGKIEYLDYISNKELCNLYRKVDLTCVISLYEGWGMPIAESLWNGTPVLTSNFGAMKEVASKGGCYLVDTTNEKSIYNAIEKLVKHKEEVWKLKEEIKTCNFPDWKTYTNDLLNECITLCK